MHFSSSSWGVFSSTKDYERRIEEKLDHFSEYVLSQDLKETYRDLVNDAIHIEDSINRQLYRIALEGLELAIATDQFTIDTSIINKILVEPAHLYDLLTLEIEKVTLKLDYEENKVVLKSSFNKKHYIELEEFKSILTKCVSGDEGKRLEDTEEFQSIIKSFLNEHLTSEDRSKKIIVNQPTNFENGLGLIIEKNTQREVGTFERMTLHPNKTSSKLDFKAKHLILDGVSIQDLSSLEHSRNYSYRFYSIADKAIYSFEFVVPQYTYSHEIDSVLHSTDVKKVEIEMFEQDHNKYNLVQESVQFKESILNLELEDPLHQMKYEEFKSHRASIIQAGKEAAKQEKIYNQFADLELDF